MSPESKYASPGLGTRANAQSVNCTKYIEGYMKRYHIYSDSFDTYHLVSIDLCYFFCASVVQLQGSALH